MTTRFAPEYKTLLLLFYFLIVLFGPQATKALLQDQEEDVEHFTTPKASATQNNTATYDRIVLGKASWYGIPFHGRLTANGEKYNMHSMTAAHKSLPFDTIVKVTNLVNKETVIVRINDRGPYIHGRNIDLSYMAAKQLNMVGHGVIPVKLEVMTATNKFVYRGPKYVKR